MHCSFESVKHEVSELANPLTTISKRISDLNLENTIIKRNLLLVTFYRVIGFTVYGAFHFNTFFTSVSA